MAEKSKFAQFIASKKLDGRRILIASRKLEGLEPEDRLIRLKKRQGRKAESSDAATKETRKSARSGRPVTPRALAAAMTGGSLSGPTKTRILKAVNHLLEQKKQAKVELKTLF
jgi:hypothetical protein